MPDRPAPATGDPARWLDIAIERGDAALAWATAHDFERGALSLDYALAIVVLLSTTDPDRFEAAARRWNQRGRDETRGGSGRTAGRLERALEGLPGLDGVTELSPLCAAFGWEHAARALEHLYPTLG